MIGYMVTWTTYGTWLQGDERGYVRNGKILEKNNRLKSANQRQQKYLTFRLKPELRQIVKEAILEEARRIEHKIFAIAVCSSHIHIVLGVSRESIEQVVHRYKYTATLVLRKLGEERKIWSKGFNKRFCFTEEEIKNKISYVQSHDVV